ncbi:MAG TPA: PatB family C-S lyase [Desulfomonilaceae bacterium]|nr:PatB family C-S lyase [Desulfomonilaceae bacterium]
MNARDCNIVEKNGFDFDTLPDRRGTSSEKWGMYEQRGILPFWLADMDFRSPPPVVDALRRRVDHGVFGYTHVPDELIRVVQDMLESTYGWHVEPDWLVWLPGLVTGLNVACRAVGDDGDQVLTAVPVYPPFLSAPRHSRKNLVKVPLVMESGRWVFDMDRLKDAMTPATRLFLLCNPHNPVGRVFSRDELSALLRLCVERDTVICSDEIHCGLILDADKKHVPTATLGPEAADRTITLMAPSKTFNLPGLGCAFAIISNPELRTKFRGAMAGIVPYVNTLGYTAALAAYRDAADWHAALLEYLRANRDVVFRAVNGMPGLSMAHVEATYLAWIDCRETSLVNPVKFFEASGVGLGNGAAFDGRGFVRLTFGCPRSLLTEALGKMAAALSFARQES